jgi:hypothetical protein
MKQAIWMLVPALALTSCGDKAADDSSGDVREVTINAKGEDGGNVRISADGKGSNISIDGDGVNINADLPGIDGLDIGSDFDIDGVKLYPGAKITSINVNADETRAKGQQGVVDFGLTAPAAPDVVLAWYAKAFADKGMTTTTKGSMLTGTTKDGDAFAIELAPDGTGSKGKVRISG